MNYESITFIGEFNKKLKELLDGELPWALKTSGDYYFVIKVSDIEGDIIPYALHNIEKEMVLEVVAGREHYHLFKTEEEAFEYGIFKHRKCDDFLGYSLSIMDKSEKILGVKIWTPEEKLKKVAKEKKWKLSNILGYTKSIKEEEQEIKKLDRLIKELENELVLENKTKMSDKD